jgi:hypothetical protein
MNAFIPHSVVDTLIKEFNLKNDANVAKFLKVPPSTISKWRHGTQQVTAEKILTIYDKTGWSIEKIRGLLE